MLTGREGADKGIGTEQAKSCEGGDETKQPYPPTNLALLNFTYPTLTTPSPCPTLVF